MKAIETHYKGCRFRSRLEARWAVFFDTLGVSWEYENYSFNLGEAGCYLPDFWLPGFSCWIEVKGTQPSDGDAMKCAALSRAKPNDSLVIFGPVPLSASERFWFENYDFVKNFPADVNSDAIYRSVHPLGWDDDWGAHFHCPVCGFNCVHFGNPGDDTNWSGRGAALRIPMNCECGCRWELRLGFHKGFSFLAIENATRAENHPGLILAGGNEHKLEDAYRAARSARFEFGETPQ